MTITVQYPRPFAQTPRLTDEAAVTTALAAFLATLPTGPEADQSDQVAAYGAEVMRLRHERGQRRWELAEQTGIDPLYLTLLEGGFLPEREIAPAVVARLARALLPQGAQWTLLPWTPAQAPDGQWTGSTFSPDWPTTRRLFPRLFITPPGVPLRRAPALGVDDGGPRSRSAGELLGPDQVWWLTVRDVATGGKGTTVAVVVRDAATTAPLADCPLGLELGGRQYLTRTDANGLARFNGLPPEDCLELHFLAPDKA